MRKSISIRINKGIKLTAKKLKNKMKIIFIHKKVMNL